MVSVSPDVDREGTTDGQNLEPGGSSEQEAAALGVFRTLPDARFNHEFAAWSSDLLAESLWTPDWTGPWWQANFQEEWRRLLVRLYVGGLLVRQRSILESASLSESAQQVVRTASQSAAFARLLIDERVQGGVLLPPGVR